MSPHTGQESGRGFPLTSEKLNVFFCENDAIRSMFRRSQNFTHLRGHVPPSGYAPCPRRCDDNVVTMRRAQRSAALCRCVEATLTGTINRATQCPLVQTATRDENRQTDRQIDRYTPTECPSVADVHRTSLIMHQERRQQQQPTSLASVVVPATSISDVMGSRSSSRYCSTRLMNRLIHRKEFYTHFSVE